MLLNNAIKNWSVSKKITALISTASIVVGIAVGSSIAYVATDYLQSLAQDNIQQIASQASNRLESYLNDIKEDLLSSANSQLTAQIIREFNEGWNNIYENPQQYLTKHYIDENQIKLDKKISLIMLLMAAIIPTYIVLTIIIFYPKKTPKDIMIFSFLIKMVI